MPSLLGLWQAVDELMREGAWHGLGSKAFAVDSNDRTVTGERGRRLPGSGHLTLLTGSPAQGWFCPHFTDRRLKLQEAK